MNTLEKYRMNQRILESATRRATGTSWAPLWSQAQRNEACRLVGAIRRQMRGREQVEFCMLRATVESPSVDWKSTGGFTCGDIYLGQRALIGVPDAPVDCRWRVINRHGDARMITPAVARASFKPLTSWIQDVITGLNWKIS